MVQYVAEQYVKEVEELKALCLKMIIESGDLDLEYVDKDQFEFIKKALKLLDTSNKLMLEMAENMDEQNKKLDKILAELKK